jgi:hypothetical protein
MKNYFKLVVGMTKIPKMVSLRSYGKFGSQFSVNRKTNDFKKTDDFRNSDGKKNNFEGDYVPVESSLLELFKKHLPAEEEMYQEVKVTVEGDEPPAPIEHLKDAEFHRTIISNASKAGIDRLTPIQKYSFPIANQNHDFMVFPFFF